jgi:hypothetical protein
MNGKGTIVTLASIFVLASMPAVAQRATPQPAARQQQQTRSRQAEDWPSASALAERGRCLHHYG